MNKYAEIENTFVLFTPSGYIHPPQNLVEYIQYRCKDGEWYLYSYIWEHELPTNLLTTLTAEQVVLVLEWESAVGI